MKNLLHLFASLAGFLNPGQIHNTETGRASGRTGRKSLMIDDQILHPPAKSSGNVRFCAFAAPPIPNLSEVIRGFALKPVRQAWQEWKPVMPAPQFSLRLCCISREGLATIGAFSLSVIRCPTDMVYE